MDRRNFFQSALATLALLSLDHSLLAASLPMAATTPITPTPKLVGYDLVAHLLTTREGRARLAATVSSRLRCQQGFRSPSRCVSWIAPGPGVYSIDDQHGNSIYTDPTDTDTINRTVRIAAPYTNTDIAEFLREFALLRDDLFAAETRRFLTKVNSKTETINASNLWDITEAHPTSKNIWMNPRDYAKLRPWMRTQQGGPGQSQIDFETHRRILRLGVMAYYRGATIRTFANQIPEGHVYSFGDLEATALLQERTPLRVHIDLVEGSGSPDKLRIFLHQQTSTAIGHDIRLFKLT